MIVEFLFSAYSVYIWFVISIVFLIVFSRKNILLALVISSLILGLSTLGLEKTLDAILNTVFSMKVLLFSFATGVIAYIGGLLSESGAADEIVASLGNRPKLSVSLIPALFGMLPMPGGAILSAPIVDKSLPGVSKEIKGAINVYFRHVIFLIYPLQTTLLFLAIFTGLDLISILIYVIPMFPIATLIGYLYYLKKIATNTQAKPLMLSKLIINVIPLIVPVFIYVFLERILLEVLALTISVLVGVLLALLVFEHDMKLLKDAFKIRPHFFFALTLLMWLYLEIATNSLKVSLSLTHIGFILSIVILPFILGFLIGRIQFPALVGISLYLAQFGVIIPKLVAMSFVFAFLGYVMSPVHPCVIVTAEYFRIDAPKIIRKMIVPVLSTFTIGLMLFLVLP